MQSGTHPQVIYAYIEAANQKDAATAAACFTEDALVNDESQDYRGRDAIRAWVEATTQKYQPQQEVLDVEETNGEFLVTTRVSGDFPGSPAELPFRYRLEDGLIRELRVG